MVVIVGRFWFPGSLTVQQKGAFKTPVDAIYIIAGFY